MRYRHRAGIRGSEVINPCCETSMSLLDTGEAAEGFELIGKRNPIGTDKRYYSCKACGCKWVHTVEGNGELKLVWNEII